MRECRKHSSPSGVYIIGKLLVPLGWYPSCLTLQGALQKGIYPINTHYIIWLQAAFHWETTDKKQGKHGWERLGLDSHEEKKSFHWFHQPNTRGYISLKLQVLLRLNIQRTAAQLSNHHHQLFLITSPLRSNLQDSLVKRISAEIASRQNSRAETARNTYVRNWKVISSNTFTNIKRASQFSSTSNQDFRV